MIASMDTLSSRQRVLALGLLAAVFAFGLFDHSLWSANDSREGAMIREMYREGVWVAPVFNGRHYLEKPPLLHWTSLGLCHAFGRVNEGLVRLPAALFGFGAVVLAWLWGRRLGRERAGLAGAFLCASSVLYFEYTRIVLTDAALTFMVMLALFLFWRTYDSDRAAPVRYIPFLLATAVSFYAKGLIGPAFVWLAVGGFLVWRRRWKLLLLLALAFLPVALAAAAPWLIALWRTGGREYLATVLWANQFGRFFAFSDPTLPPDPFFVHKEAWTFYLAHLPARLLPWTLLVAPALVYWFRRPPAGGGALTQPLAAFLRCALAAMALLLQLSSAKAASYAMPLFPLLFLMTAIWLEDTGRAWTPAVERWLIRATLAGLGAAALLWPLSYIGLFLARSPLVRIACPGSVYGGLGLALLALVLAGGFLVLAWNGFRAGQRAQTLLAMPVAAAVLMVLNAAAFFPAYDRQRTYEPFAELLRREAAAGRRLALAGDKERDGGAFMFYLDARLPMIPLDGGDACGRFLDRQAGPAGIIVSEDTLAPVARQLSGCSLRVLRCGHAGYKSAEFGLLVNDAPLPGPCAAGSAGP